MFLATTALKEFWDINDELLLLGPWCMRFDDSGWLEGLQYRLLPNVWDDRARLEKAAIYCQDIQQDMLAQLADYLGSVHGERLKPRYWQVLLGAWLLYYCHQLFDRHTQIEEALRRYPDAKSIVLDPGSFSTPRTTSEFLAFYHADHYNLQLYSEIFRFLGKDFPVRRRLYEPSPKGYPTRSAKTLVFDAAAAAARAAIRIAGVEVVTDSLYPIGRGRLWRWTSAMRGRTLPLIGGLPAAAVAPAVGDTARLGLARLHGRDEFRKLLIATLPTALPTIALEGFAMARGASPARHAPTPHAVMASTGWFYDDFFKLAAAEWMERGAQLWGLQHGGQYGTAKYSLAESFERSLTDRYFTWGWSALDGDPKLRDLPMPKLAPQPRRTGGDILVLTLENVRNTHHLFPHPLGWQWQQHFSWLKRFLVALKPILGSVSVRLYPHDYGWGHLQALQESFVDLKLDSPSVPLAERVAQARLVVTDYPGTPFFELLAMDMPSVHFWEESLWETRASALPYFSALRRAGVLYTDPESAARQVLGLDDPLQWWRSPAVQQARAGLVEHFALSSPDWISTWRAALLDRSRAR